MAEPKVQADDAFHRGPIPTEAVAWLKSKGIKPTLNWQDAWGAEYKRAFYVSKMLEKALLKNVQDSLAGALEDGVPFGQWAKDIRDTFDASGWSDYNGQAADNPRRLLTVYDTNVRMARAAGVAERVERTKDALPYLQFNNGPTKVRCEDCEPLDGLVLPVDDEFWLTHWAPLHFGCACWLRHITTGEAQELGVDTAPEQDMVEWENDDGEKTTLPAGVMPGFGRNVVRDRAAGLADEVETLRDQAEAELYAFDPDQARDDRGRWASGAGGAAWRPR